MSHTTKNQQKRQFSPAKPEVRNEERAKLISDESPNVTFNESSSVTHQYTPPDESLIDKTDEAYDVRREENDASKSAPKNQNQHLDESSITEPITSQTEMSHPPISHLQPIQKEKKRKKRKKIPTYVFMLTSPGVEQQYFIHYISCQSFY